MALSARLFIIILLMGAAQAQSLDCNRLCINNGGEYTITGINHSSPNKGCGKYFPSFSHWTGRQGQDGRTYPWKIRGWCWHGRMDKVWGPMSVWTTALQRSVDNPYGTGMSWNYPLNYALGTTPVTGPPNSMSYAVLPSTLPSCIRSRPMVFPSSHGVFDAYMNIFAACTLTWTIPSSSWHLYGLNYAVILASNETIEIPSNCSIYEYVWENTGPYAQYVLLSGNEVDCTGTAGGNKGKSYSVGTEGLGPYFYYFDNPGTGSCEEWRMCLFVNDAVTIPVNAPGVPSNTNPFASYGFDVGSATITPLASSGHLYLQAMYEDVHNPGTDRILIAASPWSGPAVPYGPAGYRIPHAWDPVTDFFTGLCFVWRPLPPGIAPGFPAAQFGTTVGGRSIPFPVPPSAALVGFELKFSSFSMNGKAPTASYMVTYW
jgi:hypothetical protein